VAERDEFELPVPICERSDDGQVKLCDIETNCKALSRCSAFLVRFRVAGNDQGKMAALLFESLPRHQSRCRSYARGEARRLELRRLLNVAVAAQTVPVPVSGPADRRHDRVSPGLRRDDTAVIPRLYEVFSQCIGESIREIGDLEVDL
jgi:hypothetical protein